MRSPRRKSTATGLIAFRRFPADAEWVLWGYDKRQARRLRRRCDQFRWLR